MASISFGAGVFPVSLDMEHLDVRVYRGPVYGSGADADPYRAQVPITAHVGELVATPALDDAAQVPVYVITEIVGDEYEARVPWSPAPLVRSARLRLLHVIPARAAGFQRSA